ncbi:MAG: AMP nucleosidase [Bacteroidia bacterium]|nr:AMP nucleosidase [Bacteroidia bacterium]
MKTKNQIVKNWLPRYTGTPLKKFGDYIILVNFSHYLELFAQWNNVDIKGADRSMPSATADNITIINFGMGSPNAGTIIDLLTAVKPKAAIFLGKCGGIKSGKNKVGDLILPIAAIRGEGTSDDYMPSEVPALPAFALQKAISTTIQEYNQDYWTGTIYTTNKRVWEHRIDFKEYLKTLRPIGIDMETATLFIAGFKNQIPMGALLLVSDMPMFPEGVKTEKGDVHTTEEHGDLHLKIGIDSLKQLMNRAETIKHLKF